MMILKLGSAINKNPFNFGTLFLLDIQLINVKTGKTLRKNKQKLYTNRFISILKSKNVINYKGTHSFKRFYK